MASDRASTVALRELIAVTDLTLETIPDLPQNRTAHCRENLRAALALTDDLLRQRGKTAAQTWGTRAGAQQRRSSAQITIARWPLRGRRVAVEDHARRRRM